VHHARAPFEAARPVCPVLSFLESFVSLTINSSLDAYFPTQRSGWSFYVPPVTRGVPAVGAHFVAIVAHQCVEYK